MWIFVLTIRFPVRNLLVLQHELPHHAGSQSGLEHGHTKSI